MRVLITGAAGFLGAALARAHLVAGDEIFALRHVRPIPSDLVGKVEEIRGDLRDADSTTWPKVDVIYHCAALMADREEAPYSEFRRVNVVGTAHMLNAARVTGSDRFVHVSSAGVLGPTTGPATELSPYGKDLTKYERSKMESEDVARAAMREGLPVTIVRPAQLYGPGMRHGWPRLIREIGREWVPILGHGAARIHFTHVDDAVQGIRLTAIVPRAVGQVYHIAAAAPITIRHAMESITAVLGVRKPRTVPYWPTLVAAMVLGQLPAALTPRFLKMLTVHNVRFFMLDRVYSIEKARTDLGYHPVLTWDSTIASTVAWYKQEGWI